MAPNKKSLSCVAESLSNHDLAGMIKSEFLPLTFDAKTLITPAALVVSSTKTVSASAASDDYWNWSAEVSEPLTTKEQECYWDECTDEPSDAVSSSDNYWDWNANPHAHVLSAAHIEANLKAFIAPDDVVRHAVADSEAYWNLSSVKDKESRTVYSSVESNDYWYSPNTEDQIKTAFIARILKEESVRQMLSADNVQRQLQQAHSDSYWEWEEQSQQVSPDHDNYWEWKAEARPVSLAPDNYWDM
jgi:hypothetical protein